MVVTWEKVGDPDKQASQESYGLLRECCKWALCSLAIKQAVLTATQVMLVLKSNFVTNPCS